MEKVTIVLPVYNGQDHLTDSIDTIIKQTYSNWELIIVNDCSTDKTLRIAEEYEQKDKRIKVISNKQNMKLPKSLNIGFENATGEFYTWTSDDNKYSENALEVMVNYLKNNADYGMVYCDMRLIDKYGTVIKENPLPEPENIIFANTVGGCFLYRSDIAQKVGEYDDTLFLAEDYEYWLRIYQNTKIKHISQMCYEYRCHEKSLSGTRNQDIKRQTAKVWKKHYAFIRAHLLDKKERYQFWDQYMEFADIDERKILLSQIRRECKQYILHYRLKYKVLKGN